MILNIIIFFINCHCKNIILNIKKLSFEKFYDIKSIDEYINYDIYTDLFIGTPPQKVTNFIEPNDSVYQFKKITLQYNNQKFNTSFISKIEESTFSLFNSNKSSSYKGYYSDNFIFTTYENKTLEVQDFQFTIYLNNRNEIKTYGIIGLFTMISPSSFFADLFSFVNQLKNKNIIDDYVFTFLYNNNNVFEEKINLGQILIGECPYIVNNEIFKKDDEIKTYSFSNSHWSLMIDEIKFVYNKEEYIENHIEIKFDFFSKFIKGSKEYNEIIQKIFFDKLINENLCKKEIISENKYTYKYEIYSCNKTNIIKEKIINFPSLYLTIKSSDLYFIFSYNDLFKDFEDKIYFMIIFPIDGFNSRSGQWLIGEIFLRKYIPTFNLEAKSISFFKKQINKANNYREEKNSSNINNVIRIIIEIFMGMIILIFAYLIYRKYRKSRKILANELEDGNYAYIPKEKKENQLMNEKN